MLRVLRGPVSSVLLVLVCAAVAARSNASAAGPPDEATFDPSLATPAAVEVAARSIVSFEGDDPLDDAERALARRVLEHAGNWWALPWSAPRLDRIRRTIRWAVDPSDDQWAEIEARFESELGAVIDRYRESIVEAEVRSIETILADRWSELPVRPPEQLAGAFRDCSNATRRFVDEVHAIVLGFGGFLTAEQAIGLEVARDICTHDMLTRSSGTVGKGSTFDAAAAIVFVLVGDEVAPKHAAPLDSVGPLATALREYVNARRTPLDRMARDRPKSVVLMQRAYHDGALRPKDMAERERLSERYLRSRDRLAEVNRAFVDRADQFLPQHAVRPFRESFRGVFRDVFGIRPRVFDGLQPIVDALDPAVAADVKSRFVEARARNDAARDRLQWQHLDVAIRLSGGVDAAEHARLRASLAELASAVHANAVHEATAILGHLEIVAGERSIAAARSIVTQAKAEAARFERERDAGTATWAWRLPEAPSEP